MTTRITRNPLRQVKMRGRNRVLRKGVTSNIILVTSVFNVFTNTTENSSYIGSIHEYLSRLTVTQRLSQLEPEL
jgi:hypothetical protein